LPDQPIEELIERLERERQEADRLYNEALTAVDHAIQTIPLLPEPPGRYDVSRLEDVNKRWDILRTPPPLDRSLKGRLRAFIWRVVGPPLEEQKHFNAALVDHMNRNVAAQQDPASSTAALIDVLRSEFAALVRFESLLIQFLQTITVYVDSKDRSLGGTELRQRLAMTEQRLLALKREVERVFTDRPAADASSARDFPSGGGSGTAFTSSVDSVTYVGFEDRFRGSREEIRSRVEEYLPLLASASDVVDVGCGRGELLSLLQAHGVSARGVDANQAMVELCRSQGLQVEHADALSYLERQRDGTIGGLVAIQVVEHFEPAYLTRFLEAAYQRMRPGAPLLLETINAACWMAFFETYIRDLTHQRPLHPDTLRYLVQASGFSRVDVQFLRSVGEGDRLEHVASTQPSAGMDPDAAASLARTLNSHADKLNARLFSSMDYVVIARR
jgi:SAM-dependent methyltransferase